MTNKEKLEQMFQMQKELDLRIMGSYDNYPLNAQKIALFVELGELMNELPTLFKHWKKTAVDNREKALEELVDCWHFAISLELYRCNIHGSDIDSTISKWSNRLTMLADNVSNANPVEPNINVVLDALNNAVDRSRFITYLTTELGFTLDEVYQGYLKKNKVNHQRQDENY